MPDNAEEPWPTLHDLRRAKVQTIRSFFHAHNSRSQSLIENRLQQISEAHEIADDLALIEPLVLTAKCLVGQLREFNEIINECGTPKVLTQTYIEPTGEVLRVILLDTRYRHISTVEITKGSINESLAHPRDIFRPVIGQSAYAFELIRCKRSTIIVETRKMTLSTI